MICSGVRRDAAAGSQWQKIEKKTGLRSGGSYRNWQLQTMEEVIGGSLANLSSHTIKRLIRRAFGQLIPVAMTYNNVCWRKKLTSLSYGEQENSFLPLTAQREITWNSVKIFIWMRPPRMLTVHTLMEVETTVPSPKFTYLCIYLNFP